MPFNGHESQSSSIQDAGSQAGLEQVRLEVQRLRHEQAVLLEQQRAIMELIGTKNPEKIVHDLRNVLNERNLLRTLTEGQF